jgi:hypothetical protein
VSRRVPEIEVLNADGLTLKAHASFADQFADGLAGAGQRLAVHDAVLGLDLRFVTGPEVQNEAAAGQVRDRGGGHGNR